MSNMSDENNDLKNKLYKYDEVKNRYSNLTMFDKFQNHIFDLCCPYLLKEYFNSIPEYFCYSDGICIDMLNSIAKKCNKTAQIGILTTRTFYGQACSWESVSC